MAFVFDPRTAKIRVRLTEMGMKLYFESLQRLKQLSQDDGVVGMDSSVPITAVPDSAGYYEMHLWLFIRAFGGFGLFNAEWLQQYFIGDSYEIICPELAPQVTYPS